MMQMAALRGWNALAGVQSRRRKENEMATIEQIDKIAYAKCDELVGKFPDVWYCLDGYRAYIYTTKWGQPGQPAYVVKNNLQCIPMVLYSFDTFKKEHLRAAWLSGRYTEKQLRDNNWQEYASYCHEHYLNLECK
jgi:hypothetical protein